MEGPIVSVWNVMKVDLWMWSLLHFQIEALAFFGQAEITPIAVASRRKQFMCVHSLLSFSGWVANRNRSPIEDQDLLGYFSIKPNGSWWTECVQQFRFTLSDSLNPNMIWPNSRAFGLSQQKWKIQKVEEFFVVLTCLPIFITSKYWISSAIPFYRVDCH